MPLSFQYSTLIIKSFPLFLNQSANPGISFVKSMQPAEPMEYIIDDNSVTITEKVFLRKYVNTVYDRGKNGVLNVTDNNHLILKAFATAWKYRELYEQDGGVDNIIRNLHTSPRQFYRYLDIAYMNPEKINEILSGKLKINVNNLFQIAQNNQLNQFQIWLK